MNEQLANELIQELAYIWNKYCDAFEEPVYASYILMHLSKVQKLIWDEITEQRKKKEALRGLFFYAHFGRQNHTALAALMQMQSIVIKYCLVLISLLTQS